MAATYLPADLFQKLFERDPPAPLRPVDVYAPELTPLITDLQINGSAAPAPLVVSLHLLNDDIKSAHKIAEALYYQDVFTCDYQHALLHIKDGDYGNARWWLRRLTKTSHALLLQNFASGKAGETSTEAAGQSAKAFVVDCERVGMGASEGNKLEQELYNQLKGTAEWSIQEFVVKKQE